MKTTLITIIVFAFFVSAKAQTVCDSVYIQSIYLDPFLDTVVWVQVDNQSSELFDYPGFILRDNNGDSVAAHHVFYFGIGTSSQMFGLGITNPNAITQGNVFTGTLELWKSFYDTLMCTYPISQVLWTDSGCTNMVVSLQNYQGATLADSITWTLTDNEGNVIDQNGHTFDKGLQDFADTLCLPPGCYTLTVTAPDTLGNAVLDYGISTYGSYSTYGAGRYGEMQGSQSSDSISFHVYTESCDSLPNSIADFNSDRNYSIYPNPFENTVMISSRNISEPTTILVTNLTGEIVYQSLLQSEKQDLQLSFLPAGMYLVKIQSYSHTQNFKLVKR